MQGPRWIGRLIYLAGLAARGAAVYGYMITAETVNLMPDNLPIRVVALYHFVHFPDPQSVRDPLYDFCDIHDIKGTILLAHEGINGTVAGTTESISALVDYLNSIDGYDGMEMKFSAALDMPFRRLKVKIKPEIVTMGVADIDPSRHAGTYVDAADWNTLISDPDTLVIDTRNDYEVAIGSFKGAINPHTTNFREFPAWLEQQKTEWQKQGKTPKLAMFCTGGIRCEKSTALAKKIGLDDVYHLKGGILRYLEDVPVDQSMWQGDCFVFDDRVAVGHGLSLTDYDLCHACRMPLAPDEMTDARYKPGVSCPHCADSISDERRSRYEERHKQMQLARERGVEHLGANPKKPGKEA